MKTPRSCTAGPLVCEYQVYVQRYRGKTSSSFDYQATESEEECAGMAFKIDWRRDFFRVRIPRSCLGTPRWVRAGAAVYRGPISDDGFSRWGMIYGFEVSSKSKRVYSGPTPVNQV